MKVGLFKARLGFSSMNFKNNARPYFMTAQSKVINLEETF